MATSKLDTPQRDHSTRHIDIHHHTHNGPIHRRRNTSRQGSLSTSWHMEHLGTQHHWRCNIDPCAQTTLLHTLQRGATRLRHAAGRDNKHLKQHMGTAHNNCGQYHRGYTYSRQCPKQPKSQYNISQHIPINHHNTDNHSGSLILQSSSVQQQLFCSAAICQDTLGSTAHGYTHNHNMHPCTTIYNIAARAT